MGEITADKIRSDPDRNRLLRAIGGSEDKINVTISNICSTLGKFKKDAFLLCSDGFWEYVLEKEMQSTLRCSVSPEDWINRMMNIHKKRAGENNDNYSVIAVMDGKGLFEK